VFYCHILYFGDFITK